MSGANPIERVARYLNLLGKKFKWNKENQMFLVEEKIDDKKVEITVGFTKNWLYIRLNFGSIKNLPDNIKYKLFKRCLEINMEYAEVSFALDKEENLLSEEDILLEALTLDVFVEEYNAVLVSARIYDEELKPIISESKG